MYDSTTNLTSGNNEFNVKLNEDQSSMKLQDPDSTTPANFQASEAGGSKRPLIVVYYFHPMARCETCLNIEAYSKEAVNSWKKKYDGKVEWKALNIDEKENEHYVNQYSLQFSSVVLSEQSGGKELKWKNLADIWKLANNKNEFISYLKDELEHFTNETK